MPPTRGQCAKGGDALGGLFLIGFLCAACGSDAADTDGGSQASTCDDGLSECGNECVNLTVSVDHCGACGETCADAEECVSGQCLDRCAQVTCASNELCDDGVCYDPCDDVSCSEGLTCVLGTCEDLCIGVECAKGLACREGECVDLCAEVDCAGDVECSNFSCNPANGQCEESARDCDDENPSTFDYCGSPPICVGVVNDGGCNPTNDDICIQDPCNPSGNLPTACVCVEGFFGSFWQCTTFGVTSCADFCSHTPFTPPPPPPI